MDSPQHCRDQSAECVRLMRSAQSEAQAQVLRNLSSSWSRLAGQIDRYNALIREQSRSRRREVGPLPNSPMPDEMLNIVARKEDKAAARE
jgi:hypothetical protein